MRTKRKRVIGRKRFLRELQPGFTPSQMLLDAYCERCGQALGTISSVAFRLCSQCLAHIEDEEQL